MLTDRQNEEPDLRRRGDPRGFDSCGPPKPLCASCHKFRTLQLDPRTIGLAVTGSVG
jgi:hypothetical protein